MSQPTADGAESTAEGATATTVPGRVERRLSLPVPALLGLLALVPTAGVLCLRLLRNAPAGLPAFAREAVPAVETLAAVVPAVAMVALAGVTDRREARVALAAVGVFALLGAVETAAWLPAAAATLVGTAAALAVALRERADRPLSAAVRQHSRPVAFAALGSLALAVSLAASAGVATVTLRGVSGVLAFATLAALPLVRSVDDTAALALWVVATLAVVVGAASAPFVAGAVVLVAFDAGTVPLALLALGLGGAVTTAVADLRRGAAGPAVGAALLVFAGVPATLPRAVAFALGLLVVIREWDAAAPGRPAGGGADA